MAWLPVDMAAAAAEYLDKRLGTDWGVTAKVCSCMNSALSLLGKAGGDDWVLSDVPPINA